MIASTDFPTPQLAVDALPNGDALHLTGTHLLTKPLIVKGKKGVTIFGDAVLSKGWPVAYSGRACVLVEACEDVRIAGLTIVGATPVLPLIAPYAVWNDDGMGVIDCRHVRLEGLTIRDCGDSLLRVCGPGNTTDPVASGIVSYDVEVRGCTFRNGYQISTTPSGVDGYLFINNKLSEIVGSAKWASRNVGAGRLWIQGNEISGSANNRQGLIELHGQQRVVIDNNVLRNAVGDSAITLRDTDTPVPVLWDDVTITTRNVFENVKQRIGVYAGPRRLTVRDAL